jgi:hypothetical protein
MRAAVARREKSRNDQSLLNRKIREILKAIPEAVERAPTPKKIRAPAHGAANDIATLMRLDEEGAARLKEARTRDGALIEAAGGFRALAIGRFAFLAVTQYGADAFADFAPRAIVDMIENDRASD